MWSTKRDQIIFVRGAEWATEREKARAEAAEARVKYLEGLGSRAQLDMLEFERSERRRAEARAADLEAENARLLSQYSMAKERRVQIELALRGIREVALRNGGGSALTVMGGYSNIVERADAALATTPTTEAVTEVEGS